MSLHPLLGRAGGVPGSADACRLDRGNGLNESEFVTSRAGELFLRHRPELGAEELLEVLARHRAKVARGPSAIEHWGADASVSRDRLGDGTDVAVKWNHSRGFRHAFAERMRGSRARRAVVGEARVRALGLAAPRVVAWAERRSVAVVWESYLVNGFVGDGEPIPVVMPRFRASPTERRELVRRLGETIGRLHGARLDHHDLKHSNLLRCFDASIVVLDLEALERCTWLSLRRRVRALGQVEAYTRDLYPWLPQTDRLRFLNAYLLHSGFAPADRRTLVTRAARWADARMRDWARRDRSTSSRSKWGSGSGGTA